MLLIGYVELNGGGGGSFCLGFSVTEVSTFLIAFVEVGSPKVFRRAW